MGDFAGVTFFDGDFLEAVADRPVDGAVGQGDVKGYAVVVGGEGLEIGADFVTDIAIGGGAVGAGDAETTRPWLIRWPPALSAITV